LSEFLFTVPSGEPVTLEPFHYAIIGQTQFSGKTTLIRRLSEWIATQDYTARAIIIVTNSHRSRQINWDCTVQQYRGDVNAAHVTSCFSEAFGHLSIPLVVFFWR